MNKRTRLLPAVENTKQFQKDWDSCRRAGRYDMNKVAVAMTLVYSGNPIPADYLDHPLKGKDYQKGERELHVGGDHLLIYRFNAERTLLTWIRFGTHSELFGR
ncbi:type II toxin-antitoxin system YafQ family toxin [Erwinia sp. E602]|uniref:type II toxin-antitoxin system YafQ family toxin n=1 Tax=Erwinia sp. E602 TaxID=2675378 RepID=UPI001BAA79C1|nr:type II toxin-antitoxin system YafQ family toxin [Erwinia sp. E602]